jgi:hypothetical protein
MAGWTRGLIVSVFILGAMLPAVVVWAADGDPNLPPTINRINAATAVKINQPNGPNLVFLPQLMNHPWLTAFTETFEGVFPGKWELLSYAYSSNGSFLNVTGQVSWGQRTCRAVSGTYGGWAVGGGSVWGGKSCADSFPPDVETWMTYGPIDLSAVKDGQLTLKIWSDDETNLDSLGWGVSLDNDWFYGNSFSGDSQGWLPQTIDLKNVYRIGNVTGKPSVWVGVWFKSNATNTLYEEGVAIDDLVVSTCGSVGACGMVNATAAEALPSTLSVRPFSRSVHQPGPVDGH